MLIDSPYFRNYIFTALEETPALLKQSLKDLTESAADERYDPERFTLREMVAHLSDWETVFLGRFNSVVQEDQPELPNIDEGERAVQRDYANSKWQEELALFAVRRSESIAFLKALPPEAWSRTAIRPEIGTVTLQDLVLLLPLHDIYHLKQVREFGLK